MIDAYSESETYQKVAFDYEEILKWRWKPEDEGILTFLGTLKWPRKKWDFTLHPLGNLHQNG